MFVISFKYFIVGIGNMCDSQRSSLSHIFHALLQIGGIIKMENICMLAARQLRFHFYIWRHF